MKNIFETLVGAIVLVVAAGFVFVAYEGGTVKEVNGYELTARFDRVDGLSIGSNVRISGLNVGKIISQHIDPATYTAVVRFSVDESVKLPEDSSAEIISDGLLGSKYLALIPGGSDAMLTNGGEVLYTQSAVSIEALIGKFMFGSADKEEEDATSDDKTSDNIF